jgi:energy-coupling factor transporter ATP-binding protein EcfA2
MFENDQICPYTGLRSFTEEESLYFKGREEDIDQATIQLQKNKFLMLTGASGDGKSSLIYAGIIPNARSGFLKSKYTQWCVADFRPERTPFQNLCRSIGKQLAIPDINTVEAELNHGFSAIADLYRNSKRYLDTQSPSFAKSTDKEKAATRREAANLIILVDQFEEFFTNPENYHNGTPSRESVLVLNLLLETARIALDEDLPIYVVFTMRSDYIGQCAAFRGLPEYLGFSQFFVPRLNRSQLQQVIEEPAKLSGNRISRRLTERLIHDITEGVDQLPILQHALNQIWVAADQGKEEMDLLHYAMVGGMSVTELPDEQVERFNQWFSELPEHIRKCYHEPNLQNVLDTHTNKLYEQASGYIAGETGRPIPAAEVKGIIRTAFVCLTKIDQSRAVRNRMTLQEITNIIGNPSIDARITGTILNIFREPGNTFIHPFIIEEDPESRELQPEQVLDITHESLIRNWKYLGQWAREEFESRSISLDFEAQLGRWVKSDKSNDFLLSIGPLTYFENWYNKAKPNAWWIARYLPEEASEEIRLTKAEEILGNAREFLGRSADKHIITRTVMRYGPKKIAAVLGVIAMITLTSFAVKNYFNKQNAAVLGTIHAQMLKLVDNDKVSLGPKSQLVVEELKLGQTTMPEVINAISDSLQKINISTAIATQLVFQGRGQPGEIVHDALHISDSLLENFPFTTNDPAKLSAALKEMNDLRSTLELEYSYQPSTKVEQWRIKNARRNARWITQIIEEQPAGYKDMQELGIAMENAINYKALSKEEIAKILSILSPFENTSRNTWLQSNFQQDKIMDRGELGYGFFFNGLYQELAYLYAASGNTEKVLQCIDSLMAYGQNNYQGDYAEGADNAANIAAVYFSNGMEDNLDEFVKGYCAIKNIPEEEFYAHLLGRTARERATAASLNLLWWMDAKMNLNLRYSSRDQLAFFYNKYRKTVEATITDPDQRNLLTALSYKNEGILISLGKQEADTATKRYFDLALSWYKKVNPSYLAQTQNIIGISGSDQMIVPRKTLFIYPDFRLAFHPMEQRSFYHFYNSDLFLEYILKNRLFDVFYPGTDELKNISSWLADYNVRMFVPQAFLSFRMRYSILQQLDAALEKRKAENSQDFNLLYLNLGQMAQAAGDKDKMLAYYRKLVPNNLLNNLRTKEYANNVNNNAFRLMAYAVKGFVQTGHMEEAFSIVSVFKKPTNRSSLYAFAAAEMQVEKLDQKLADMLIDSSRIELNRTQNVTGTQPNREVLAYALALQNPEKNKDEIYRLIKNLPQKMDAIRQNARASAFHQHLYEANSVIPALISDDDIAGSLWQVLYSYNQGGNNPVGDQWNLYQSYYLGLIVRSINYEDESN